MARTLGSGHGHRKPEICPDTAKIVPPAHGFAENRASTMSVDRFFLSDSPALNLLYGDYDLPLVALSLFVAILAGIMAVQLAGMARSETRPFNRQISLLSGAFVLGSGVWSMHFIGMLAYSVCSSARYDPTITLLSMLPSFIASWIALLLLAKQRISGWQLVISGLSVGAGIGVMHYSGMAAVHKSLVLRFDPMMFAISIVVAVALSVLTLWLRFGLIARQRLSPRQVNLLSGTVLGTAISGMHYTGMAAARFLPNPDGVFAAESNFYLALSIAGTTILAILITGAVNVLLRYRMIYQRLVVNEARLRDSEQQYRSLIGNLPGVAFRCQLDSDWRMLFISDAVERLSGWRPEDFTSGAKTFTQLLHPDDREWTAKTVHTMLSSGRSYSIEYRIIDRTGREHWVSESASGVRDATGAIAWIDGVIIDITDSKRRNAEFEGVVNALNRSVAVIEFDLNGLILHANPNFRAMTGYRLDELVGNPHAMLCMPEEVASTYHQLWADLRRGIPVAGDFHRVGKNGKEIWIHGSYNPIFDPDGHPYKIIKFASDLSDRHAMELDLREAKARAEQAAAVKSTFLANMSHEIRTPMNAILGFTDVLLSEPVSDTQRRHLTTVRNAGRSLLLLLNDILDTAKLERGAVELEIRDFSLRDVCMHVLASLRINAQAKGLPLVLDYPDAEPEFFQGDALRIQQVLLNLLGNAIKFTEQGQVSLSVRQQQGIVHLVVRDTGIGIAADRLGRIFDPFAQADASMNRRFGGTGLGTTIARQLIELMRGRIWVESEPGIGSQFHVEIPLPTGEAVSAHQEQEAVNLPPLSVLAADDVPQNLELLQILLSRLGHRISTASNGEEAVRAFAGGQFDIVLMDVQMPVLSGLDASREIRRLEAQSGRPPTPIIALTASVLAEDARAAREAGMDGFASKPVDLHLLTLEIARLLNIPVAPDVATTPRPLPGVRGSVIDWSRGQQLWGSEARHHAALRQFLVDFSNIASRLRQLLDRPDELQAQLHRLKGAAGNLALSRVANLSGALESDLSAGQDENIKNRLDQLADELVNVAETLAQLSPVTDAARPAGPSADPSHLQPLLQTMDEALARGELPEAALAALSALLPGSELAALDQAINAFEFDTARQILTDLQTRYRQEG